MASYYQRNREHLLEKQKQYNAEHKDKIQEYWKVYYENNKDYFFERRKTILDKLKLERRIKKEQRIKEKEQRIKEKEQRIKEKELIKQEKLDKLLSEEFEETKENLYWELVDKKEKDEVVIVPFQNIKKTSRGFVLEW
jgi:hypothetical protein